MLVPGFTAQGYLSAAAPNLVAVCTSVKWSDPGSYHYTGGLRFSILVHIFRLTVCHGNTELDFPVKLHELNYSTSMFLWQIENFRRPSFDLVRKIVQGQIFLVQFLTPGKVRWKIDFVAKVQTTVASIFLLHRTFLGVKRW